MTAIIEFLLNNKLLSAVGLVAVFFMLYAGVIKLENIHLETKLSKDAVLIRQLKDANQQFADIAKKIDQAMKAVHDASVARQKAAADAIAHVDKSHDKKAANIAATTSTGDDCKDAKDLLAGYIAGLK